jgi:hypothetical protein
VSYLHDSCVLESTRATGGMHSDTGQTTNTCHGFDPVTVGAPGRGQRKCDLGSMMVGAPASLLEQAAPPQMAVSTSLASSSSQPVPSL